MTVKPAPTSGLKTLFLDRDGTIIVEKGYLSNPSDVKLELGAAEGIRRFAEAGFRIVVVSNQSGIGRGYLDECQLAAVNARVKVLVQQAGAKVDSWYHCPHAPSEECSCRKPLPGMLDAADADQPVDWTRSVMVGDKPADVEAARARGVEGVLVLTGYGTKAKHWAMRNAIPTAEHLEALADHILGKATV